MDTYWYIKSHVSTPLRVLLQISFTLSAFWNLNFVKIVIPPFCISEKLTGIHTVMLSFVSVIYPITLIIITCVLIELHARNNSFVHLLCKPFSITLKKMKVTALNSNAVIHALGTYVLLSSTANVWNLTALTFMTTVFMSIDGSVHNIFLYFDPNVVYLSWQHILYLLIAGAISVFLVLIPSLLLCVYPTRIYGKLSQCISTRLRLAIMTFAETLHCCFKDGLNGTRDWRSSAGLVILYSPVFLTVTRVLTISTGYQRDIALSCTLFITSLLVSYIRPCKSAIANLSLSYHCTVLGLLCQAYVLWDSDHSIGTKRLELTIIILPLISHILVFVWVCFTVSHYVCVHFGHPSRCKTMGSQLKIIVSQCFHKRHGGYKELLNTPNTNV